MTKNKRKIFSLVLVMWFLYILAFPPNFTTNINTSIITDESHTFHPSASTDKYNPVVFDSWVNAKIHDTYPLLQQSYYYKTYFPLYRDTYYFFWLREDNPFNDFDLYLYSSSSFGVDALIAFSASGYQNPEWFVYRTSNVYSSMYLRAYTWSGTGNAYIGYFSCWDTYEGWVGIDFTLDQLAVVCTDDLTAGFSYTISLDIQSQSDFDLYVFRLDPGTATQLDLHYSKNAGLGIDESITFTPDKTGEYVIVVLRGNELGQAVLTVTKNTTSIPPFELLPIIFAFTIIVGLFVIYSQRKGRILIQKTGGNKNE